MAAIDIKISAFVNRARTRLRELGIEYKSEFDFDGYQSDKSKELGLKVYEARKFISLLATTDRGGLDDFQLDDLIDFFWKWLELRKVNAVNYSEYSMPVQSMITVPDGTYATVSSLNSEVIARQSADQFLSARIDAIENALFEPASVFPSGFWNNYNTSYAVVFTDDIRLHTHTNKTELDAITSTMVSALQALPSHYSSIGEPSGVHVSSEDRTNWNSKISSSQLSSALSAKADSVHTHTVAQIQGLEDIIDSINTDIMNMAGEDGDDGREIELSLIENILEWRYVGDDSWNTLGNVKGDQGEPFTIDVRGLSNDRLNSVYDNEEDDFTFLETDTGFLYFRDPSGGTADTPSGWTTGLKFVGDDGWAPVVGVREISSDRAVFEIVDWVGGSGQKPSWDPGDNAPDPVRWYVGPNGPVLYPNLAVNIRGPRGAGHGPIVSAVGDIATRDDFDNSPAGFIYLRNDVSPQTIFIKNSDDAADWSVELPWQGPPGTGGGGGGISTPQAANTVYAGPTSGANAEPAFRALVVNDIPDLSSEYLALSGGTLTGFLTLHDHPVSSLHPASKGYVDNLLTGLAWKSPAADIATTGDITLSGEQTIDDVITSNSKVLVKDQIDLTENGLWISDSGAWTRSTDADDDAELIGATILVLGGTVNANTQWTQISNPVTIGVTGIVWAQIAASGVYTNGAGLTLTGNVFSVTTNGINNSMLRQGIANSVIGRSGGSLGNVADIQATVSGHVLRLSGSTLGFGFIGPDSITQNTSRLLGRTTASAGATEEIQVGNALTFSSQLLRGGGDLLSDLEYDGLDTYDFVLDNMAQVRAVSNGYQFLLYDNQALIHVDNDVTGEDSGIQLYGQAPGTPEVGIEAYSAVDHRAQLLGRTATPGTPYIVASVKAQGATQGSDIQIGGGPIFALSYNDSTHIDAIRFTAKADSVSPNPRNTTLDIAGIVNNVNTTYLRLGSSQRWIKPVIIETAATSFTIEDVHRGSIIFFTSPTGCVVTLGTSGIEVGHYFTAVRDEGAGDIQFVPNSTTLRTDNDEDTILGENRFVEWIYKEANVWSGAGGLGSGGGGGSGSVTSFSSGDLSPLFTTIVDDATSTPNLSFTAVNQNANLVYAGPSSGAAAAPTFRSLVPADVLGVAPMRDESGSTYTITDSDLGYTIIFTNPSGCICTLNDSLSNNFWFTGIRGFGAGSVQFVASSTVLNTDGGEDTLEGEFRSVSWKYDQVNNEWYAAGALGSSDTLGNYVVEDVDTTTYEFDEEDNFKIKRFTNAGGCTANIPVGLSSGWRAYAYRADGAGVVTITSDGTVEGVGTTLDTEETAAEIIHRGSNIHVLLGALGGTGFTFGTSGQIPFINGTDDDFVYSSNLVFSSGQLIVSGFVSRVTFTSVGSSITIFRDSIAADGVGVGQTLFQGRNDADQQVTYASVGSAQNSDEDGLEDASISLSVAEDGGLFSYINLNQSSSKKIEFNRILHFAGGGIVDAGSPPSASPAGQVSFCTNEVGGATIVFSDGTNWRRVQDYAIIST